MEETAVVLFSPYFILVLWLRVLFPGRGDDHDVVGVGKEEGRAWPFAGLDLGNVLAFVLQLKFLRSCLGIWVRWIVSSFFFLVLGT